MNFRLVILPVFRRDGPNPCFRKKSSPRALGDDPFPVICVLDEVAAVLAKRGVPASLAKSAGLHARTLPSHARTSRVAHQSLNPKYRTRALFTPSSDRALRLRRLVLAPRPPALARLRRRGRGR